MPYVGRFAPSPTGALHAGSLVAALASWLDARAHRGRWLLRIEDVDRPRCSDIAAHAIVEQLGHCGLRPDAAPLWQHQRDAAYRQALAWLASQGLAYPCHCSRRDIEEAWRRQGRERQRDVEWPYPGTCRPARPGPQAFDPEVPQPGQRVAAWRLRVPAGLVHWQDRWHGPQQQDVAATVGDFVLRRADGLWAYQLAVVVDDAAQGITDVVRGADLADNTARQILLQRALGLPTPHYLHTPLVLAADGHKLSKQNGAEPLALADAGERLCALRQAAAVLDLPAGDAGDDRGPDLEAWLGRATAAWAARQPGRAPMA